MFVSGGGFFYRWEEAEKAGVEKAGGKGWNLGRLFKYGFPVPRGGVLSAGVYETFLDTCNLRQEVAAAGSLTLDSVGETSGVEQLDRLREKIMAGRLPAGVMAEVTAALEGLGILHGPLAVRSSAVAEDAASASFAGIHEYCF